MEFPPNARELRNADGIFWIFICLLFDLDFVEEFFEMKKEYPFDKKYIVYSDGRVFSKKTNKFLKTFQSSKLKYNTVQLKINGNRKNKKLSVLVLETFVSPRPKDFHAAHLNGNNKDDRLKNLAWTSPRENAKHKRKHGTYLFGEEVNFSKLTENEVLKIRKIKNKFSRIEIAEKFKVTRQTIGRILNGKTWKNLKEAGAAVGQ